MKKVIAITLAVVLVLTLGSGIVLANNGKGNGANVIDVNGFHYTLNIIGKKADWSGNGDYDHGSTMFVPANSEGMFWTGPDGTTTIEGVKISVGLGPEFAVTDGNAFDEIAPPGTCAFELPKDRYSVWIAMRGKPGFSAEIKGWIYDSDTDISLWCVGTFTVSRKWKDATQDLLYVDLSSLYGGGASNLYVFDLMNAGDNPFGIDIDEYFWSLKSNGAKLIKVRIYPE